LETELHPDVQMHVQSSTAIAAPLSIHSPLSEHDFGNAFTEGYQMTFRFLLSKGAPSDLAEELAQSAWAKGWECRAQLRTPTTLGAWVNSIAKNLFKNRLRFVQHSESLVRARTEDSREPTLDLESLINRCDRVDAAILHGYYVEGYTTNEIAERIGMCPVAVRVRLHRVRRSLRSQLCMPCERRPWSDIRHHRRGR
jgi:RNA polymerase sigma factor (sigma-70 family)